MKITGIICEYNPFHNGHLYHLQKARELTNCDLLICITTGYFSMRGDLSVLNKYEKTKVAIDSGCDLVILLPYLLGTQNADIFANNAVKILNMLKVDTIVSGSETGDLTLIKKISELEKSESFQAKIKESLKQGNGYPKAFSEALETANLKPLISNDLLNLKYYDAIQKINKKINLKLIKRIHNNYQDETLNETNIQSASALRETHALKDNVPDYIYNLYKEKAFINLNAFGEILKHLLLNFDLSSIFQNKEGLGLALKKDFKNIDDLINTLQTKRYTKSRIRRFITYVLTNTTTSLMENLDSSKIRVLGFNKLGQKYLNSLKKELEFIVTIKEGLDLYSDFELKIAKIFTNVFKEDYLKIEQKLPYKKEL